MTAKACAEFVGLAADYHRVLIGFFVYAGINRRNGDNLRFFHDSLESYLGANALEAEFRELRAGHGLGLVVDGIIRGIDGAIDVASEPGKGTTVQVMLPSAEITIRTPAMQSLSTRSLCVHFKNSR